MAFPLYLAMTAAELARAEMPENPAYMACRFSHSGAGLSGKPDALPPGAMLIVNDSTPYAGHDAARIAQELCALTRHLESGCVLFDLERPDEPGTAEVVAAAAAALQCPVGVSAAYAGAAACAVFLPPVPPHVPLSAYLAPWAGREIWLEAAYAPEIITLTPEKSEIQPLSELPEDAPFADGALFCHYGVQVFPQRAEFCLCRTPEDLSALLRAAESYGVTRAVGLYQELRRENPDS